MLKNTHCKFHRRAFTLVELLIVIAIIGILAVIVTVNYIGAKGRARDAKRITDIESVQTALVMYYADKKSYPLSGLPKNTMPIATECTGWANGATNLSDITTNLINTGYLPSWPKDSLNPTTTGNDYCYIYRSSGTDYAFMLYVAKGASNEINWLNQSDLIDPARDDPTGDTVNTDPTQCSSSGATINADIHAWKVYSAGARCW